MREGQTRQLVAIMFADMVGYTALMQGDEGNARTQRDRHRAILSSAVQRHHGEVLQYYGDGTLSIFASAVEAVQCAVELQLELAGESLIPLRIGVHTGDIVHDADGVFGDGVNVASRIEGLSAPGGVMVSGKVFDEIKNHPSLSAVSVGVVRLKKVEYRLQVFAISNEGLSVPTEGEVRAKAERGGEGEFWPVDDQILGEDGTPVPSPPVGAGEAFLQRIKDRALIQWALVYLAGAWVVLQVTGFAADRLSWSPLIPQGIGLLAFIGLFVTLVVAWYHGERGRQRVRRAEILLITVLLAIAGAALSLLPSDDSSGSRDLQGFGSSTTSSEDRPSVAALPWANRSGDEEDAYFTDGIHDEILTRMSKIQGLRVISRQSVMQFRDSPMTAGEIAAELGVRYILEGGLLRAGDSVRLNVQLIDAQTDDHTWAGSYDRFLSVANLLSIQAEVAQAIADTLRATVTPEEQVELGRIGTTNLEAYDFFLQGLGYAARPGYHQDDFRAAEALFERAIALDPEFAHAHASLSRVHGLMFWERFDPSPERFEAQRAEAEEALRLQPDLPLAHAAIGWMHYVRGNFREALEEYETALEGMPNDAEIVSRIGYTHRRLGNWPEVYSAFEDASRLNPRDANLFYDLGGHSFGFTRRYADAIGAYARASTLAPDLYDASIQRGLTYLHWQGQIDTLRAVVSDLPRGLHLPEIDLARVNLALWERDSDGLLHLLESVPAQVFETQVAYLPKPVYAGWAHRLRGDESAALAAFDSARVLLEPLVPERPNDERILVALGYVYAGLGRSIDSGTRAADAVRLRQEEGDALSSLRTIEAAARVLAQAGLADQALVHLETVMANNSPVSVHTLRLDPLLDPIRGHPRFQALLERYAREVER
ncbi:adenylate/guanylate cyclase domain-containing protein [Gemmatimonadota bacterium]